MYRGYHYVKESVTYEEATQRVQAAIMPERSNSYVASELARIIWPGHMMRNQGAAIAAARFIRRMETDGILIHVYHDRHNGVVLYRIAGPDERRLT